jgi:hypothetical protein
MARSEISETKAFLRLVSGTLTILGLLTAVNVLMIMNSLGTNIFKPITRNIAAVTTVEELPPVKVASPIIEINCLKKLDTVKVVTKASSARVFFKNCQSIGRLINETNRNQGDVFPLKKNQWTSDFINLKEGKNSIKAPIGDNTQTIEITRELIKKKTTNKAL